MVQLSKKEKYEIIVRHEIGFYIRKIVIVTNINKNSVSKWLNRFDKNNNVNIKTRKCIKKTSKKEDKIIINEIKKNMRANSGS